VRLIPAGDDLLERLAIALNLAPLPGAHAMFGMPAARTVVVAQRVGLLGRLAERRWGSSELAAELELTEPGTRLLLDCLVAGGHVAERDGRYGLSRQARRWLDPRSQRYVGTWLDHAADYWEWYGDLERVIREGRSFEIHSAPADDPSWRRYIEGQFELARLSATEVARKVRLPDRSSSLLDVAGAHGWFAAELCRRHDGLRATVLDLPGSVAVGREIIAREGMSDRVIHREGDMFEADLGGPHDGALCFDIVHHLGPEQVVALLRRVRESLRPGGTVAILDMFRRGRRPRASAAYLGLFFHLTSGADLYRPDQLADFLAQAGFERIRRSKVRRIPDQALYQARAA
jgi:SAM-dependent methyltransferase